MPFWAVSQTDVKKTVPQKTNNQTDIDEKIYSKAIRYGDFIVAKQALYSLMAKNPEKSNYLDSLMRLYFSVGNYAQCILTGKDYLQKDPENQMALEMIAISENSIERHKDALANYEKLYAKSKNIFHAYQIAVLNYTLKRYEEAKMVQIEIINHPQALKDTIQLMMDSKEGQYIPFKAAAYNLKGVTEKEQRLFDEAKLSFEAALKVKPNFVLAKNNLQTLVKPESNENKPEVKTENRIEDKK